MIRKEAWSFYRPNFGARLYWELENLEDLKVIVIIIKLENCFPKSRKAK